MPPHDPHLIGVRFVESLQAANDGGAVGAAEVEIGNDGDQRIVGAKLWLTGDDAERRIGCRLKRRKLRNGELVADVGSIADLEIGGADGVFTGESAGFVGWRGRHRWAAPGSDQRGQGAGGKEGFQIQHESPFDSLKVVAVLNLYF